MAISPIMSKAFSCKRDDLTIRGYEYRKTGSGTAENKQPAVIFCHGFLGNQSGEAKHARYFAKQGYAAYTFDFNGGGIGSKSSGLFENMSVMTEVEDLKQVIKYVQSRPYVDAERIILHGGSQGGFVSGITAAQLGDEIWKLIMLYPARCIPDDARSGKMLGFEFDPENIPERIPWNLMKMGRCYPACVIDKDPYELLAGYSGPTLIVHGTDDKIVNVEYSKKMMERYIADRKKAAGSDAPIRDLDLVLIEGAGHGYNHEQDEVCLAAIQEFIEERTKILEVDVRLTGVEKNFDKKTGVFKQRLPFDGTAETAYFKGTIAPGAADDQQYKGTYCISCRADYVIEGTDYTGAPCKVHVVNAKKGKENWKPTLETDSAALSFVNGADCRTVFEGREQGPIIRIYTRIEE